MSVSLVEEVRGVGLGDKRLDRRLGKVIEELGAKPSLSIPAATDARAEMEAAYRFFDNDKVSPEKILQPHADATRERISQEDLTVRFCVAGAGHDGTGFDAAEAASSRRRPDGIRSPSGSVLPPLDGVWPGGISAGNRLAKSLGARGH